MTPTATRRSILIVLTAGAARAQETFSISVNVDLVVLQVTVRDPKGGFATDLLEKNFEVFEDGVRQSVKFFQHEDVPVTVGLIIDHSGSMQWRIRDVATAARTFVRASSPNDEMFVVNFNENVTLGLPAGMLFSNQPEVLERAILSHRPTGQTSLYDAVLEGLRRVETGSKDKKVLVVVSDGGDNKSSHTLPDVLKKAGQSSTVIYSIGVFDDRDADTNPDVLKKFAKATGGEAFFPAEPAGVIAICETIARDIRNQYALGYVSSNAVRPGSYRSVRVVAKGAGDKKLQVRSRTGYISASEAPAPKPEGSR